MAHTYIHHGQVCVCDGCGHQTRCTRFVDGDGLSREKFWFCPPCVTEGKVPPAYVIEMWCTECEGTIPTAVLSD
jgi:hypothetical protein